jgi:hypothetical protein
MAGRRRRRSNGLDAISISFAREGITQFPNSNSDVFAQSALELTAPDLAMNPKAPHGISLAKFSTSLNAVREEVHPC